MQKQKKDAFLILRVPEQLKTTLVERAKETGKNLSTLVREILENREGEKEKNN